MDGVNGGLGCLRSVCRISGASSFEAPQAVFMDMRTWYVYSIGRLFPIGMRDWCVYSIGRCEWYVYVQWQVRPPVNLLMLSAQGHNLVIIPGGVEHILDAFTELGAVIE